MLLILLRIDTLNLEEKIIIGEPDEIITFTLFSKTDNHYNFSNYSVPELAIKERAKNTSWPDLMVVSITERKTANPSASCTCV